VILCLLAVLLAILLGDVGFTSWAPVLVLAEVELISFIVASVGLWFGFVLNTVLVTQGHFSHCRAALTQCRGLFCLSPHPTSEWAGGAQGVGMGHSRDS